LLLPPRYPKVFDLSLTKKSFYSLNFIITKIVTFLIVTAQTVVWLFFENDYFESVIGFYRLQGSLTAQDLLRKPTMLPDVLMQCDFQLFTRLEAVALQHILDMSI
jgi:hypothetical protein